MNIRKLEKAHERAVAKMDKAERFSSGWFQAKAEVERIATDLQTVRAKIAPRTPGPTDEQLAAADWVLRGDYDDC